VNGESPTSIMAGLPSSLTNVCGVLGVDRGARGDRGDRREVHLLRPGLNPAILIAVVLLSLLLLAAGGRLEGVILRRRFLAPAER
jgi:hypothetical protein